MYEDKYVFVMPTYNTYEKYREGKISRTASEVLDSLISAIRKTLTKKQEVIIIDDGCTDETEKELTKSLKRKKARQLPQRVSKISYRISEPNLELTISMLKLNVNKGLNIAVVRGYKEALKSKPEFVIKLDSDGEHNPSDFPKLLKFIKRVNKLKLVYIRDKDQILKKGFGFRIIICDALKAIISDLEKFAYEEKRAGNTRGVDQKTKVFIEERFGKTAVDSC